MPLDPFAAIAFLGGAALNPTNPPAANAALSPTDPRFGGSSGRSSPTDPRASLAALTPTDPRQGNSALMPSNPPHARSPKGWEGVDADWTYANLETLMAQALRKSRAKVVRAAPGLLTPEELNKSGLDGSTIDNTHLWRWAPEFRVKAIAGELMSRFQVNGRTLLLLKGLGTDQSKTIGVTPVFEVPLPLPPGPLMDDQVDKVVRAAVEREDRLPEILSQAPDIWPFFESITGLDLGSAPRTSELFAVANDWALHLLMQLKHGTAARRPVQASTLVMPVIATPGHGSLPSGHATMSALTSELLHLLLYRSVAWPPRSDELDRLARRIAFNRVVAGVHFPFDSAVGYRLGTQLARLLAALGGNVELTPGAITAKQLMAQPLELKELAPDAGNHRPPMVAPAYALKPAELMPLLWRQAEAELATLRA
jgi:hypothetical protein